MIIIKINKNFQKFGLFVNKELIKLEKKMNIYKF